MRQPKNFFDEKIKTISRAQVIYDIGGGSRFQKKLSKYRDYFSHCDYRTVDIDKTTNPDILADVHNLPIANNSADAVICNSVLQHTYNPFRVVGEIYRILKRGGMCYIYVPFIYPYHGGSEFYTKDYWRFSRDGVLCLLAEFSTVEIEGVRGRFETIALLLPYSQKFPASMFVFGGRMLDRIFFRFQSNNQVSGFHVFCVKQG